MKIILALGFLFTNGALAVEVKPTIKVLHSAQLPANRPITLGDIGTITGFSGRDTLILRSVKVGATGDKGTQQFLENNQVAKLLRQKLKTLAHTKPTLNIPERVEIIVPKDPITAQMIDQKLKSIWSPLCDPCEVVTSFVQMPQIQEIFDADGWSLKVEPEIPKGSFSLPLEIITVMNTKRIYWVNGRVDIFKQVPTAARAIGIGEMLTEKDVKFEKRNLSFATDSTPTLEDLVGKRARSSMAMGQILWSRDLEKSLALKRGDAVKISAAGDTYSVTVNGIAEQDGSIGEMVKVKNPRTNTFLSATVTGRGEVRVE